jgi:hypothetical protein
VPLAAALGTNLPHQCAPPTLDDRGEADLNASALTAVDDPTTRSERRTPDVFLVIKPW